MLVLLVHKTLKCDCRTKFHSSNAAGLDFEGINERLTLSAAHPSVCVPVQTVNTGRAQDGRNLYFECILLRNVQPTSFSNVVLGRGTTTVQIKGHQDGKCLLMEFQLLVIGYSKGHASHCLQCATHMKVKTT